MSKKSKREAYFKLAELLVAISGTLIIGVGIFVGLILNSYSAMQTNTGLIK